MKRSTNLSRSAAGDRRNTVKHLVEAMRMVGATDDEIRAALLEMQNPAPAALPVPDESAKTVQSVSMAAGRGPDQASA